MREKIKIGDRWVGDRKPTFEESKDGIIWKRKGGFYEQRKGFWLSNGD